MNFRPLILLLLCCLWRGPLFADDCANGLEGLPVDLTGHVNAPLRAARDFNEFVQTNGGSKSRFPRHNHSQEDALRLRILYHMKKNEFRKALSPEAKIVLRNFRMGPERRAATLLNNWVRSLKLNGADLRPPQKLVAAEAPLYYKWRLNRGCREFEDHLRKDTIIALAAAPVRTAHLVANFWAQLEISEQTLRWPSASRDSPKEHQLYFRVRTAAKDSRFWSTLKLLRGESFVSEMRAKLH